MPIWLCALYFYFFFLSLLSNSSTRIYWHYHSYCLPLNTNKHSQKIDFICSHCELMFQLNSFISLFFFVQLAALYFAWSLRLCERKKPRLHVECIFFHYFFSYYPFRTLFFMLCSNIWCSIIKFFLMCNLREERKVWMCNCSCLYEFKFEFIEELELMLWLRFKEAFGAFFRAFGNA